MKIILLTAFVALSINAFCQNDDTEWDDYFMPGVGYKMYVPKNTTDLGVYHGVMTEFVIYARAKGLKSSSTGPARIKTYGNLSIMSSTQSEAKDIFYCNMGLNLSLEGKTDRKFLIPYFGLETGGLFQRDFSTMQFSPVVGFQLVSTKKILWNVQGGYQYTTKKFDEYSGYTFSSTFNILLWND
ncbi:MAG: hypothetical protein HYZ14_03865 [Bacteroidetes bacterium]|nr:hypothetical protein [Bacteroidota bacterium]